MITIELDNRKYEFVGAYGCILESQERNIKQGDVRVIKDILFYAYNIGYSNKKVSWVPVGVDINREWINNYKKTIFGVES